MMSINANDLKRNGIAGIERAMLNGLDNSIMVDVRGKAKYVILPIDEFNRYREYQLEQAIREAERCIDSGKFTTIKDVENYASVLEKEIANDV